MSFHTFEIRRNSVGDGCGNTSRPELVPGTDSNSKGCFAETLVHGSADVGAETEASVGSLRTSQDKTAVLQSTALLQVANYKADDEILEMSKGIK